MVAASLSRRLLHRECYGGLPRASRPYMLSLEESSSMLVPACVMRADVVPLFALDFSPRERGGSVAAIADEEGFVSIVRDGDEENQLYARQFEAHSNAVFDVRWTKDGSRIATASGDQTVRVWNADVMGMGRLRTVDTHLRNARDDSSQEGALVADCRGHAGSVKCIAVSPESSDVIVSGSRDGAIRLWDLRTPTMNGSCCKVEDAHRLERRPRRRRGRHSWVREAKQSVTAVEFSRDGDVLVTGGAADGVVKFWDRRVLGKAVKCVDCHAVSGDATAAPRPHGIGAIAIDRSGSSIAVSCVDSTIYVFDIFGDAPQRRLSGHSNSTFYVKLDFSIEGSRVLSGSKDGNAYIWDVSRRVPTSCDSQPMKLSGHRGEVTGVRWSPFDVNTVATIADDAHIRFWKPGGELWTRWEDAVAESEKARARAVRERALRATAETPTSRPVLREFDANVVHEHEQHGMKLKLFGSVVGTRMRTCIGSEREVDAAKRPRTIVDYFGGAKQELS